MPANIVSDNSFRIFPWLSDDDLDNIIEHDLKGHLKVKSIFLNRNPYFWHQKWKEREILRSNISEHNTTTIAITSKEKTTNKDDSFPADTNENEVVDMDESVILEDNPKTDTVKQAPALWPLRFTDAERSKYCEKDWTFFQNKNSNFKNSNSSEHKQNMMIWIEHMRATETIDINLMTVMESVIKHWTENLKIVVAVIKFIAERGLAFRGTHEAIGSPDNENYLGILELISDFDPFLKEHIILCANKGRGTVLYLSKTICEELITIMSEAIKKQIISEIKRAKYWGLVVDSTPDMSHIDQLSVIFRYYYNGHVYERFFFFLPMTSHTSESLSIKILQLLEDVEINISNCRAQTYDNGSNMSGKYSGLQAIKEVCYLAVYVLCVGHSLNLVVTRWSCRVDAVNDAFKDYNGIHNALLELENDDNQKADTRHEAASLRKNMTKLEFACMAGFWHRVLNQFHRTTNVKSMEKTNVQSMEKSVSQKSAENLVEVYKKDLENTFVLELEQFVTLLKEL
ncbi:hypothetical protein TSAR_013331 [Trichomalopsis sarcophagae]|uniref:DUF4371 domain-containing protein n=1 Tax=Trichomalopsis sarcophagae TaxID=543379 RepID=A0A232EQR3_9HYME|nr:hypothetical protein TSAR_013331 [Trichomalopsis sarcophagae]